jgi:hypothetical protein
MGAKSGDENELGSRIEQIEKTSGAAGCHPSSTDTTAVDTQRWTRCFGRSIRPGIADAMSGASVLPPGVSRENTVAGVSGIHNRITL